MRSERRDVSGRLLVVTVEQIQFSEYCCPVEITYEFV